MTHFQGAFTLVRADEESCQCTVRGLPYPPECTQLLQIPKLCLLLLVLVLRVTLISTLLILWPRFRVTQALPPTWLMQISCTLNSHYKESHMFSLTSEQNWHDTVVVFFLIFNFYKLALFSGFVIVFLLLVAFWCDVVAGEWSCLASLTFCVENDPNLHVVDSVTYSHTNTAIRASNVFGIEK